MAWISLGFFSSAGLLKSCLSCASEDRLLLWHKFLTHYLQHLNSAFLTVSQNFQCFHVVSHHCCLLYAALHTPVSLSPAASVPSQLLLLICSFLSHCTASPLALLAVLLLCSPHLGIFRVLWVFCLPLNLPCCLHGSQIRSCLNVEVGEWKWKAAHSFQASYLQSTYSYLLFSDKCFSKWSECGILQLKFAYK